MKMVSKILIMCFFNVITVSFVGVELVFGISFNSIGHTLRQEQNIFF